MKQGKRHEAEKQKWGGRRRRWDADMLMMKALVRAANASRDDGMSNRISRPLALLRRSCPPLKGWASVSYVLGDEVILVRLSAPS